MTRGIDNFHTILADYRKLFVVGLSAGAATFIASISSLAPPWPSQIAPITSIAQLIVLILVYQLLRSAPRRIANRVMIASFVVLLVLSFVYLNLFMNYTFQVDGESSRRARGFYCTQIAQSQYPDKCPMLTGDQLNEVEYVSTRLWTQQSINLVHTFLITIWMASFMALATLVGTFVVYQQRAVPDRKQSVTSSRRETGP